MDDNSNADDVRQSLYEEFLSEVVKAGNPEAFFDETDLVEIYDYSSDMDNYIAKMEVLLYGARHYPDSQALATRRAWFYSSFGEMEAAAELNSRVSNGGVLNELLRLRADGATDTADTRRRLDEIVDATTDFADEELIQLVDFCAENNMLAWVEDNYDRVKSKCSYPQTFIYEYANRCEDLGDAAKAVSLFEELTMLEPFTLDFWERLAGAQYRAEQYEAALSSADYALAISPDSVEAIRMKGMALYALKRDMPAIIELMEPLVANPQAIESDLSVLVGAMVETGRAAEAVDRVTIYLDTHSVSRNPLGLLLSLKPESAATYLAAYEQELARTGGTLISWAGDEYTEGNIELASRIVQAYLANHTPDNMDAPVAAEILFRGEVFAKVIEICRRACVDNSAEFLSNPGFTYSYVLSLIRMNRLEDALRVATEALQINMFAIKASGRTLMPPVMGLSPVGHNLLTRGFITFLYTVIHDISDSNTEVDCDSYVPGP